MSKINVPCTICDKCGAKTMDKDSGFTAVTLSAGGEAPTLLSGKFDLCPTCSTGLVELLGLTAEKMDREVRTKRGWSKEEDYFILSDNGMSNKVKAEKLNRSEKAVLARKSRLYKDERKVSVMGAVHDE